MYLTFFNQVIHVDRPQWLYLQNNPRFQTLCWRTAQNKVVGIALNILIFFFIKKKRVSLIFHLIEIRNNLKRYLKSIH